MQRPSHDCTKCPAYNDGGMADRLQAIERQMAFHAECLEKNSKDTEKIKEDTREIRELMELGRTAFKLLDYTGRALKWIGGIAAAIGGAYAAWKNFKQ